MLAAHLDPLARVAVQPARGRQLTCFPSSCSAHAGCGITSMRSRRSRGSSRYCRPRSDSTADYSELYIVAILTAAFRGLLLPYLLLRIIRRLKISREVHVILQASSSLVIGAFAVIFALAVSYRIGAALDLAGTIAVLALTVMLSMKLIGFLMLSVRHEAISQILGLLVLENGVFLGAQILVPGMPLLIEIVILFDLLVVVACFGVLVRYLLTHVGTTSSLELKRLVG